jgi:uncharacterized membrane protein
MFKINLKIQFLFFAGCLFMIGIGLSKLFSEGIKHSVLGFLNQVRPLVPFIIFACIFGNNIYSKKVLQK